MCKGLILLVEDDPSIAEPLTFALQRESWQVTWFSLAAEALQWLTDNPCDFIILDVGLPDMDGFDLCRKIRNTLNTPLLFLTARNEEIERIIGLEIGADDYCPKPFSSREVISRIKAIWRRMDYPDSKNSNNNHTRTEQQIIAEPQQHEHSQDIRWGDWHYDALKLSITFQAQALQLTRYEMRLLEILLRHPERVWSRGQLMQMAWEHPDYSLERTVDSHIKTIRQKIKQIDNHADPIKTHRSLGYSLSLG